MGKSFFRLLALAVVACAGFTETAHAACGVPVGSTITCTGGQGASVAIAGDSSGNPTGPTVQANNYPATLAVSGAPAGATVSTVTLRLNGYTAAGGTSPAVACTLCGSSRDVGIILQGPGGDALQVMSRIGSASSSNPSNITIEIQDGATAMAAPPSTAFNTSGTFAPTNYSGAGGVDGDRDGEVNPVYTPSGPSSFNTAAPLGTATLTSTFAGKATNGTWSVFLADDAGNLFGLGANVSFTSYDLIITYSAASVSTTTTLSPSSTTVYTTSPNNTTTLTATVSATSSVTGGTINFQDGATSIGACGAVAVNNGTAACSATFSAEGLHVLTALYSGTSTFISSTGSANVFVHNHATNTGTTYCNAGPVNNHGQSGATYTSTVPYPSVIFVGDGVNTDITNSVNTLSVQLKNLTTSGALGLLLVAPDGAHAFEFWSPDLSMATLGNYTIQDGSVPLKNQAANSPGTYGPTDSNNSPTTFTPNPPSPAPQVPGSFSLAEPAGSKTFQQTFSGAAAHGAWSLFFYDVSGPGQGSTMTGGWCLNISQANGHPTTTTVISSANPYAALGSAVTFTATVASAGNPTPNLGTVTFTENGAPVTGAPNSGVANVVNGVASISTTSLPEGDHTITAEYHDATAAYNDSFGTVSIRIDRTTSTPTLSGSTWSFCNAGGFIIPGGTVAGLTNIGPAGPNPSNVFVANLPGKISSATLTLNGFNYNNLQFLQSALVGPSHTQAETLDFFTLTSASGFSAQNTIFTDSGSGVVNGPPAANQRPESIGGSPAYTASLFFTLPAINRAATAGAATFASAFANDNANGTWSLYFNQTSHSSNAGGATSWCMNLLQTAVTGTGTTAHVGTNPNNHMVQGGTGSVTFSLLNNGDGPTGDPDQAVAHAMTVTGTVPAGLTLGTVPTGSPWNCTANTTTQVTCTNLNSVAEGTSYALLSIPVIVASTAPSSATVSGFTFSGAGMTGGTFSSDTITIDPSPLLSVTKLHTGTFTQGSIATWTIQVNNIASGGATNGTTTVVDALPTDYTVSSVVPGVSWSCGSSTTTTVTCTSTQVVAGGSDFSLITVAVNVPANSPVSVSNTAKAYGGGDLTHTTLSSAASGMDSLTVVQIPATINLTAGNGQTATINTAFATNLSVTVVDARAVAINGASVTFTAPATGASGKFTLSGTNTTTVSTNSSGVATASVYTANATAGGPYNVAVAAGPATQNFTETNRPGAATHLSIGAPGTATSGTSFSFSVTAQDASNNTATGYSGTVHFTSSDGAAILPANGTLTNGVGTFNATLKTVGNPTITGTDTVTSSITGVSGTIAVSGGTATHFTVTIPSQTTAGAAFNATVTALDVNNNTATGYAGTVHFTSFDPAVVFPADSTLVNGVKTFSVTLKTAGNQSVTATDTVTSSITGSASIAISAAAANHFAVSAPGTATQGTAFNFTVTALDTFSNTATGYAGTVHFTATDGTATLPSNAVLANGVGTFSATLRTAGNQTVTATDTVTSSITGTSGNINVSATPATHFSVSAPGAATAGTSFSVTVTALNAGNTTATGYSGTVHFTSSDAFAVLPLNSTLTNGVGTFNVTLKTAGSQTITGTDTVNATITGTSGSIVVGAAAPASMTANSETTPQSTNVSTTFPNPLAVTVRDAFNNLISGVSVTFAAPGTGASSTFSTSSNTITVQTNPTGVASTGTFSANATAGGPYSVTASGSGLSAPFSLTNNAVVVINPATVTNVSSTTADGTYGVAANISITIAFSAAVNVTGTPQLALNSGGTASYTSGSGTSTLTFLYTVAPGQNSPHLDYTSTTALKLNGGSILGSTAIPATLTLPAPGSAGSLGANTNIAINTIAPTVVSYNVLWGVQSYNMGTNARNRLPWQITGIRVVFSEPIANGNVNSLSGTGITTTGFTGLGTNTLTWTISPIALGSFPTTLAATGPNELTDGSGNALGGGAAFNQNLKILYGDFNDDGKVNSVDLVDVNNATVAQYNVFADMNGDGAVNRADILIVQSRANTSLP